MMEVESDHQSDLKTVDMALNLATGNLAVGVYELTRAISAMSSEDRPIIAISRLDDCERQMVEAELVIREARKIIGKLDIRWLSENKAKDLRQAMSDAAKAQREKDEAGKKPREWRT